MYCNDWRKTEVCGEKPVPVNLCPLQTPHGLNRDRIRTSAVTERRLTSLDVAQPTGLKLIYVSKFSSHLKRTSCLSTKNVSCTYDDKYQSPRQASNLSRFALPLLRQPVSGVPLGKELAWPARVAEFKSPSLSNMVNHARRTSPLQQQQRKCADERAEHIPQLTPFTCSKGRG